MLELSNLGCERGGHRLFHGLARQLGPGAVLNVQGANGAGKTSLLRMLCGLLEPSSGQVRWCGQSIHAMREDYNRHLIYIGHAAGLKGDLTALENLQISSTLSGHCIPADMARVALDGAGLRGRHHTPAYKLSQGQRQRCALARLCLSNAGAHQVPLWVLDEPFNALDAAATIWLAGLLDTHLQGGGIVVMTSHQDTPLSTAGQQTLTL
ncbi:MAG: cytochrome c biogenesis heme-transporting ATPase CcmA [Burkholderiaceae bacterium]